MDHATTNPINMKAIKNIRLKHYDYSQDGLYFVTICTNYGRPYLTNYNEKINQALYRLEEIDGVRLDQCVIMSTHIHKIIVLNDCKLTLGEIIRRFKATTSRETSIKFSLIFII